MDSMLNAMGFRRVVDYGVPIGWHCEKSGETFAHGAEHAMMCHRRDHVGAPLIPVYLPIPEGERPQTTWGETGGDDNVCVFTCDIGPSDWIEIVMGFDGDRLVALIDHRVDLGEALWEMVGESENDLDGPSAREFCDGSGRMLRIWDAGVSNPHTEDVDIVTAIRHVAEEQQQRRRD